MTRSVGTPLVSYDGSGSTGPFSFSHYVQSSSHLIVTKIDSVGAKSTLVDGTNYTVSGLGSAAVSVTLTVALAVGETLTLYRESPAEQSQDVINNSSFSSATVMRMVDRTVDMVQELRARIGNFLLPREGYGPTHATNAGKYLKLNSTGTAIETADSVDTDTFTPGLNCLVVATSNIVLSGTQTIDGVSVAVGNVVLVAGQTTKSQNGVYVVAAGAWTRSASHDSTAELQAMTAFGITSGTQYAGTIWVQLVKDPTIGTSDLVFSQWPGSASYTNVSIANGGTLNIGSGDIIATHSSNLFAWTGGQQSMTYNGGATSEVLRLVNSTDNASVQVLQLEGDRATPAGNDEAYVSLLLSDSVGTQTEFGRLTWKGTTVTDVSEAGRLAFGVMTAGTLADEIYLTGAALTPAANDGLALGSTALGFSDLYLASGGIIDFGNNEVRLTSAANSLAMTGGSLSVTDGTAAATAAITAKNTTDNATVKGITIAGDRATMANNDAVYVEFQLSDSAGNQDEFARITVTATDVANGSEDAEMKFSLMEAGTLTDELKLTLTALAPTTSDGLALGTTALMWSDAFFASGAVINFNNGDVTFTHSANTMTFGGASSGYIFDAGVLLSANDAGALGSAASSFSDLFLASGGVINWNNGDVTVTHSANTLAHAGASSGYTFDAIVAPASNDGAPLGSTTANWSDLFLASGAVINFNNGDATLTHSSDQLKFNGTNVAIETTNGSGLDPILSFRHTGVAHGVTGWSATDIAGHIGATGATGGITIAGINEDTNVTAIRMVAIGDTTTTKSTAATGVFSFDAYENDGTATPANPTANSNMVVFRAGTTTRFILDADGDSHQDVGTAWTNMDFLDDIHTLNSIAYHVAKADDPIKDKFEEWTLAKRESLEALKLVKFGEDGRPFMNMSKLAMLNTGAIRQLGEKFFEAMAQKDEKIAALERRLTAIEAK